MGLNYKLIIKVDAAIMVVLSLSMLPSMAVSLIYREFSAALSFLWCIVPMFLTGFFVVFKINPRSSVLRIRDGLLIVSSAWFLASALGGLPFLISGSIPSYIDCLFETASGFSTTGSTILPDVEILPKGMLFWRSFTHWLGGMGILVFVIALLPALGINGQRIVSAETPGPTLDKITPKISDSMRILYLMYFTLTVAEILLLCLGGMNWFDSIVHSLGTLGTGGLSSYNTSIGHLNSAYVDTVVTIFMILAGINFNLYYLLLRKNFSEVFRDFELRGYLVILTAAAGMITINLLSTHTYDSAAEAFRYASFQTASITTTTGYGTADFDTWPTFSRMVLFLLMFVGGCSSSTSGGVKVIRILVLVKLIQRRMHRKLHPRAVIPLKIQGKAVPSPVVSGIASFSAFYIGLFFAGSLLLSLEDCSMVTAASAVAACLGNIGPGFEAVGPTMNYSFFSDPAKLLLSFLMLVGRLELFTVMLLFTPVFWKTNR